MNKPHETHPTRENLEARIKELEKDQPTPTREAIDRRSVEKIKLLPCPFCGSTPTQPACFMTGENSDGCVYCTSCYANAAPIEVDEPVEDDEAEAPWHIDAAATWNRRSNMK